MPGGPTSHTMQPSEQGETMRFMLCARDRSSGAVRLVREESFATRREAVEAISGARDFSEYSGADIFLVDLDAATPVAIVPWRPEADVDTEESRPIRADDVEGDDDRSDGASPSDDVEESAEQSDEPIPVSLGVVEIDIEAWSCEDCIYISTCAKAGTIRPAECGSFQWRA
jgi:hypothetical protein